MLNRFAHRPAASGRDSKQRKALSDIVWFFAVLLLLTLLARGTAGATLARVVLVAPHSGTVTDTIEKNAVLDYANREVLAAPQNLRVEKALAEPGQTVDAGQPLVLFDKASVETALDKAKAELADQNTRLGILQSDPPPPDPTAVLEAQAAVDWAKFNQSATESRNTQNLNAAIRKRNAALDNLDDLECFKEPSTEEKRKAAKETLALAKESLNQITLDAISKERQTAKEYQLAEDALAQAKREFDAAKVTLDQSIQTNRAAANLLRFDVNQQKELIQALSSLRENNYRLLSPAAGVLTELNAARSELSDGHIGTVSNQSEGYIVRIPLTEAEAARVSTGQKVSILQNSAKVEGAISGVRENSGSYEAIASISSDRARAGSARATLLLSENDYPLCLPSAAVHQDNAGTFVYMAVSKKTILGLQNIVERVEVSVVEQAGGTAAVSGSLADGGGVIVSSTKAIRAGDRVRITQ